MVSDLTPEETTHAALQSIADAGCLTVGSAFGVALAAVAAERERIVKLLRDEAADGAWVEVARSALRAAADVIESEARVAREGSRDE